MNSENQELHILLKKLDSIVDEIRQVLVSTKPIPDNRKATPFFLSQTDAETRILMKINKYQKLREEAPQSNNWELEVASLMDIFAITENLIKKISEGRRVVEYSDNEFFNRFSDISHKIERLIA